MPSPRSPLRRTVFRAGPIAGAATLLLFVTGCGHPASREECVQIFDHSAEIELRSQNVTDAKTIADRTAAVRAARGDELIAQCVGKRITSRALECVKRAGSASEVDHCLE
jgi:hypothetical protein